MVLHFDLQSGGATSPNLLLSPAQARYPAQHICADGGCNLGSGSEPLALSPATLAAGPGSCRRKRSACRHGPATPPLASVSASPSMGGSDAGAPKVPLFMVASASEAKQSNDAPAWRSALGNLAAGATAGCVVESALYPLDTIKTRLQAMIGGGGLKALLQSGGGGSLYAGLAGNLAGVAPASALFISVYEPVKKRVEQSVSSEQHYLGALLAGGSAGTVSSLIRVPTEVVKQRLQTGEYTSALNAVKTIVSREGIRRGLYAGYGAFMLRDLPFDAIEFVSYEQLKVAAQAYLGRELHPLETSMIGAGAGGFTGFVTTPLDVLKTRLMVQGAAGRYKNLADATVQIARSEGLGAFLKGWQPRLMWISVGGFVFFPALEAAKKFFAPDTLPVEPLEESK